MSDCVHVFAVTGDPCDLTYMCLKCGLEGCVDEDRQLIGRLQSRGIEDLRFENEQLRQQVENLEAKIECLKDPDWYTYIDITKQWLTHYPPDIVTGSSGDPGPVFVVTVRNALEALEGK